MAPQGAILLFGAHFTSPVNRSAQNPFETRRAEALEQRLHTFDTPNRDAALVLREKVRPTSRCQLLFMQPPRQILRGEIAQGDSSELRPLRSVAEQKLQTVCKRRCSRTRADRPG